MERPKRLLRNAIIAGAFAALGAALLLVLVMLSYWTVPGEWDVYLGEYWVTIHLDEGMVAALWGLAAATAVAAGVSALLYVTFRPRR